MIELFSRDDYITKVSNRDIFKYLKSSFSRLPDDFEFNEDSSFIVIDDIEELSKPIKLSNTKIIPSINDSKFADMISMVDGDKNVVDIILLFSDYGDGVSLIINRIHLSVGILELLAQYE